MPPLPQTLLGRRELPYEAITGADTLKPPQGTDFISWKRVYEAVVAGRLHLKDQVCGQLRACISQTARPP